MILPMAETLFVLRFLRKRIKVADKLQKARHIGEYQSVESFHKKN